MATKTKMTLAKELAILRKLHAAEIAVNPPKGHAKHAEAHENNPAPESKEKASKVAPEKPKAGKDEKKPKEEKKEEKKETKGSSKQEKKETKGSSKQDKNVKEEKKDPKIEAMEKKDDKKEDKKAKKEKAEISDEAAEKRKFKEGLEDLLIRKFFYVPAFEIYGGVAGLYDFGPTGCAVKANLLDFWRQHFVLTENMLEVSCASLTPEIVLKASGHVDKFTDFMVRDVKTGDCYRADKLVEETVDKLLDNPKAKPSDARRQELLAIRTQAGAYPQDKLEAVIKELNIKAPDTGNDLSAPYSFNLMFSTQIGPTGKILGYMRPETAQGIFVNFKRLLEYNGGRMPFAAAQIGLAFRNEIAPRAGLLRVREFPLAEIEHFVDPNNKAHPKFKEVADLKMRLLAREDQTGEDIARLMSVGEAVAKGTINNETLGYFMARTQLFFEAVGINPEKLRFRQHKENEMAHYAKDCWDAECYLQGYGWVECVGHADRAAFDLQVHTNESKVPLQAEEQLAEPIVEEVAIVKINRAKVGALYRDSSKQLMAYLESLSSADALKLQDQLKSGKAVVKLCDGTFDLTPDMASVVKETRKTSVRKYIPSVIEPSYGVGRIIYAILDHAYTVRVKKGEEQKLLKLSPVVAPIKVAILPLSQDEQFEPILQKLVSSLIEDNISYKIDTSGASIGRKYARADEIGVPFAVTIDFESVTDHQVTIRNRDTTAQVRAPVTSVSSLIVDLVHGTSWEEATNSLPKFDSPEDLEN